MRWGGFEQARTVGGDSGWGGFAAFLWPFENQCGVFSDEQAMFIAPRLPLARFVPQCLASVSCHNATVPFSSVPWADPFMLHMTSNATYNTDHGSTVQASDMKHGSAVQAREDDGQEE